MSFHPQVRLVAATVPLLRALNEDRALFGELISSPVPDGWPEFPEAIAFTLEQLQNAPEADRSWSMQFFIDHATGRLLGSGGFAAPPVDRTVEIGYEVAPEFRAGGSAPPLLGRWFCSLSLAARLTISSRTRCRAPTHRRVYSCRWTSGMSPIRRTLRLAWSGNGDGRGHSWSS